MHALLLSLVVIGQTAAPPQPAWTGHGQVRVLVSVAPGGAAQARSNNNAATQPAFDERPADVRIEFARLLAEQKLAGVPNLASVQVIRHDPRTGEPLRQGKYAFGESEYDVPLRWYDATIPYEFPECEANLATSGGKLPRIPRTRSGYFYECIGDAQDGRLAFIHRDDGQPALYGVYFDLMPADKIPENPPPRGFVGDGINRCEPIGHSSTGLIHSRVDVTDWNGDGLPDLLVGCSRGSIVWYPNIGTPGKWKFVCARLLATADGVPIDVGYGAAPKVMDFDADGRDDLVVGCERNRVVWFRNVGERAAPRLEYVGLVESDGHPLELPTAPVLEAPDVFKVDYYPLLESVDWDNDGDQDLLAGGYITGHIYWYENTAGAGKPLALHFAGDISADGEPIDVSWAAAPAVADLDGDGDLDLISGCMPVTKGGGDGVSKDQFLHYFENIGSRSKPNFHAVKFPQRGEFPRASIASPRIVDFNADGLLDIIASSGERIFFFPNVGSREKPEFQADVAAMPGVWNNTPLAATQFLDVDGDGELDELDGPRFYHNTGRGSPGVFTSSKSLLQPGQRIDHLSGIGDDWTFQRMHDLDGDRQIDLLDADHAGHIWWHRNRGTLAAPDFETSGVQLQLTTGTPLLVGSERTGFDKLQGARATYDAGDFDGDGHHDLVTTDTFGEVMYFRQAAAKVGDAPTFEPGRRIAKLRIRGVPAVCDWNGDGRLDIVAGSSAADVVVILGRGADASAPFDEPHPLALPPAPDGAGAPLVVTDFNGDGDPDLLLHTAYGYTCFYERSFIEHGYARGEVVGLQKKP